MNKLTRIKCETDAYELPHVAELLKEYDQQTQTIATQREMLEDLSMVVGRNVLRDVRKYLAETETGDAMTDLVRESERLGLYTWNDKQTDVAEELKRRDNKIQALQKETNVSLRSERDDYRSRAFRAENRLEDITSAISGHLDEKALRSTQE